MSKKDKKQKLHQSHQPAPPVESKSPVSRRGWKWIGAGVLTLILGYLTLSKADPMGQNWASHLSSFLIIIGYAVIGVGIIIKDPVR